jgi:hypothetical protein
MQQCSGKPIKTIKLQCSRSATTQSCRNVIGKRSGQCSGQCSGDRQKAVEKLCVKQKNNTVKNERIDIFSIIYSLNFLWNTKQEEVKFRGNAIKMG